MTLLYTDDLFLHHDTGQHPEHARRLKVIHNRLQTSGLLTKVRHTSIVKAIDRDLVRVHPEVYLAELHSVAAAGGGRVEVDTVMSRESAEVAWHAAGTAIDAVERVLRKEDKQALCLVRPPGHHALPESAMGFCLLANVAIAARVATQRLQLSRILIVDWDVHHGNGTQDIFYEDEQVTFFSAHRYPFYPGTGRATESGRGPGLGSTFNLPVTYGTKRKDYLTAFENALTKAADQCRPELVIVSAGFDAHAADPVGSLGLESEDFETLTRLVQQVAATHAGGRLVSVLEGGYNPDKLAECVELHLNTLLSADT
ncbi:MAG: histone deacetylase [Planctomyces sp.]|nr:histone deacetylase [Planctomyces sp.]